MGEAFLEFTFKLLFDCNATAYLKKKKKKKQKLCKYAIVPTGLGRSVVLRVQTGA